MTSVKAQIPNECQMTKPKTNNHESTRRRLPTSGGPAVARQAKERKHKIVGLLKAVNRSQFTVYCSPFTIHCSLLFLRHWDFGFYLTFEFCHLSFNPSTTRRTSGRHHVPLGFLAAQSQPEDFFSSVIFSMMRERPWARKSFFMSSPV